MLLYRGKIQRLMLLSARYSAIKQKVSDSKLISSFFSYLSLIDLAYMMSRLTLTICNTPLPKERAAAKCVD